MIANDLSQQHPIFTTSREEATITNRERFLWFFTLCMIAMSISLVLVPRAVKKSFAVETRYVGVYWDAKCTKRITSISWGELTPGSSGQVNVFIRNEEIAPTCYLSLRTGDWAPSTAAKYLPLSWNYDNRKVALGSTIPVTLTLRVTRDIRGVSDFNFNIIIFGTEHIIGDLDHDGDVDIFDLAILAKAYLSTPSDPNWRPEADLNNDNVINIFDVTMLSRNYGGVF
jgi:hypothetical protein